MYSWQINGINYIALLFGIGTRGTKACARKESLRGKRARHATAPLVTKAALQNSVILEIKWRGTNGRVLGALKIRERRALVRAAAIGNGNAGMPLDVPSIYFLRLYRPWKKRPIKLQLRPRWLPAAIRPPWRRRSSPRSADFADKSGYC